jgi:hypothetical protein
VPCNTKVRTPKDNKIKDNSKNNEPQQHQH